MSDFTAGILFAMLGLACLALMRLLRRRAARAGDDLTFATVAPLIFAALFFYWAWRLVSPP
jgi:hypothetical protein